MTDHPTIHPHQQDDDAHEPAGARVVLHATALVLIGTIHHAIGTTIGRSMGWLNEYVDEGPWIARATAYNQRAFRIIRPWWEAADRFARWRPPHTHQRAESDHHD